MLPTNIYYHLNMLERHDLLQVRDTRVVNGIIEKHYGAGQRNVTFHRQARTTVDDESRELVLERSTRLATRSMTGSRWSR